MMTAAVSDRVLETFVLESVKRLSEHDPTLYDLLTQEYRRQGNVLAMVASSSITDPSVLACESMAATNVTAEGYPGARFHAGCRYIDQIEQLAIDRAQIAFGAQFANIQAHSASAANHVVMCSLLKPGDTLLGMNLSSGGHLTHGAKPSITGQYFNAIGYGINDDYRIDFDQVRTLAKENKPKLIICGPTAYPRLIDFAQFRAIADEVGALLLADITHIAGLVVAGEHPSPIDHAHFTTTCTHKQLFGPRGGLILMGRDYDQPAPNGKGTLSEVVQKGVFPFFQGAPAMNNIAAKARAMAQITGPEFRSLARRIVTCARGLAECLKERGYRVLTGGTDNHIVLVDVFTSKGITGAVAERALEDCGIIVNKNKIPGDTKSAVITSGIRLGSNSLAGRGLEADQMIECANLIDRVLSAVRATGPRDFEMDDVVKLSIQDDVRAICGRFPIPGYPLGTNNQ